ncbi:MAG: pantetheine-phosphate adenylyltransferase [Prevotellaceae bacterium]|jgi:pantetheine-phosphate adenylyltransferase|nr:pantetheine-phosphate adenylyltransferase [Prevotellaceae bacterium]
MKTAIFPGSFDPFTVGHFDVLKRALPLFDRIIIAVGDNQNKKTLFNSEQRKAMIAQAIRPFADTVTVLTYDTLTVELCRVYGAAFIIRGIRTVSDFDYENSIAQANVTFAPDVQTLFFPSRPEYSFISSSIVRDVLLHGGDVSALVPEGVTILNAQLCRFS